MYIQDSPRAMPCSAPRLAETRSARSTSASHRACDATARAAEAPLAWGQPMTRSSSPELMSIGFGALITVLNAQAGRPVLGGPQARTWTFAAVQAGSPAVVGPQTCGTLRGGRLQTGRLSPSPPQATMWLPGRLQTGNAVPVPEHAVGRLTGRLHCGKPRPVGPQTAGCRGSAQVATPLAVLQLGGSRRPGPGVGVGVGGGAVAGSTSACSSKS